MKKIILAVAVLMGVSAASFATEINNNAVEVRGDRTVELSVETFKDLKFKLSIKNLANRSYIAIKSSAGEVLYSEYATVNTAEYSKVFDLSNLLDGKYTFVVETNKGYVEKPFEIKTQTTRIVMPVASAE